MITKISRGTDFGGLMDYLVAVDKNKLHNVHENPRVVAGPTGLGFNNILSKADGKVIASDLRVPLDVHKTPIAGGPVWHCSLSLGANEQPLTDRQWHDVATDFMKEMGFEDPSKAGCRWVAVNHGVSREGNHHVHIVADLVREDGSRVNVWQDMPRSQKAALAVEQKHGLHVVQSRLASVGAGSVPYTAGEAVRAVKTELPVERLDLERRIRAAATSASTEAEFVRLARADGLLVRPFPPQGKVTGYSAGLPAPAGEKQLFFAGGKLARDLSLPRLRSLWPDAGGSVAAADAEWRTVGKTTLPTPPAPSVDVVTEELDLLAERLQDGTATEFAEASGELSGALAAASVAVEGDRPGELARASRQVGAWSGTRHPNRDARKGKTAGRGVGLLLLQAAMDPTGPIGQAVMRRQLMELLLAMNELHRAKRPVAMSVGRGTTMHGDPDGIDDAAEGLTTTVITLGAASAAQFARRRAKEREDGKVAEKTSLRDRFSWSRPDRPAEFGERDPLPRGLQGVIRQEEWAGMDDIQRHQVDPDNVGRWATDYSPGSPGASLPSTADQMTRLDVLSAELGRPISGAAELSRGAAAERLRAMEAKLGKSATRDAYLDAGLAYRHEVRNQDDVRDYRFEFPGDVVQQVLSAPSTVTPAAVSRSPLDWATAAEPVTKAQRWTLLKVGFSADEIAKLNKGKASMVIEENVVNGPAAARSAFEQATAEAVVAAPLPSPATESVAPPKPIVPPNRSRKM